MPDFDGLQRPFFEWLYTYRVEIAAVSAITFAALALIAVRRGALGAARRHRARSVALVVLVVAVGIPVGWYLASPIFIRTELIEPDAVAAADATRSPAPVGSPAGSEPALGSPPPSESTASPSASGHRASAPPIEAVGTPTPSPFAPGPRLSGTFAGTDEFHFGRGTATIVETARRTYVLRLEEFSVRNGPDLYVFLSPDKSDYVKGALELGKLKATDGSFGYALPPGTDPADFASAIIWCKQFSHLFAVAPLEPG
jgi:hypothetical protein